MASTTLVGAKISAGPVSETEIIANVRRLSGIMDDLGEQIHRLKEANTRLFGPCPEGGCGSEEETPVSDIAQLEYQVRRAGRLAAELRDVAACTVRI